MRWGLFLLVCSKSCENEYLQTQRTCLPEGGSLKPLREQGLLRFQRHGAFLTQSRRGAEECNSRPKQENLLRDSAAPRETYQRSPIKRRW